MFPSELATRLSEARQAKLDAASAATAVEVARVELTNAEAQSVQRDQLAATSRDAAIQAVTEWLDAPIGPELPADSPTPTEGVHEALPAA